MDWLPHRINAKSNHILRQLKGRLAGNEEMPDEEPSMPNRDTIFAKAGCPFTFRFILFLNDVDTLSDYEIKVAQAGDRSYEEITRELEKATGDKASFPTIRLASGGYLVGSERLIEWAAAKNDLSTKVSPIIEYFDQYMAPANRQLFQKLRDTQEELQALKSSQ